MRVKKSWSAGSLVLLAALGCVVMAGVAGASVPDDTDAPRAVVAGQAVPGQYIITFNDRVASTADGLERCGFCCCRPLACLYGRQLAAGGGGGEGRGEGAGSACQHAVRGRRRRHRGGRPALVAAAPLCVHAASTLGA